MELYSLGLGKEALAMPQYQVTMNLLKADPLLDIGQLTDIVMEKILPSLEALKDLQSKGKVLAGGHPVGQRYLVLFMEAESEDEVRELLGGLPLSELGDTAVTELRSFEELQDPAKSAKRGLLP
jgi:muconolactone delta-isomerase